MKAKDWYISSPTPWTSRKPWSTDWSRRADTSLQTSSTGCSLTSPWLKTSTRSSPTISRTHKLTWAVCLSASISFFFLLWFFFLLLLLLLRPNYLWLSFVKCQSRNRLIVVAIPRFFGSVFLRLHVPLGVKVQADSSIAIASTLHRNPQLSEEVIRRC